jgi:Domain of unknown function (DUF4123)
LENNLSTEWLDRIETCLWPDGLKRDIWMVVDAARDKAIYGLLLDCFYSQHSCLFAGDLAPELEVAAPYLVQLDYDDEKTRRFVNRAWGNNWGVFVKCDKRFDAVLRHLRTFLTVRDEAGNKLMFRYYDPRILRVYLPTCTTRELQTVFGPIERFLMEDRKPATLLEFAIEEQSLRTRRRPLDQLASTTAQA